MNRSPEDPKGRPNEAELEDRIRHADSTTDRTPDATFADPELAADHALRRELRGLAEAEDEALPADLRRAVLQRAGGTTDRRSARWPGLPVAMAAGLAGLLALAVVLRPIEPEPAPVSTASADDLKLALATIDRTSRRAMNVAGREVGEHLADDLPRFEIERLPYGRLLTSFRLAPPRSHQPEEN